MPISKLKSSHKFRLANRNHGGNRMAHAESQFRAAQAREKTTHVSFFKRLKFMWLRAGILAKTQIKRLFSKSQPSQKVELKSSTIKAYPKNPRHWMNGLTAKSAYMNV